MVSPEHMGSDKVSQVTSFKQSIQKIIALHSVGGNSHPSKEKEAVGKRGEKSSFWEEVGLGLNLDSVLQVFKSVCIGHW